MFEKGQKISREAKRMEYKGELQTYKQIATDLGISKKTFINRVTKFNAGTITEEELFATVNVEQQAARNIGTARANKTKGKEGLRFKANMYLFEMFNKIVQPELENEMIAYMKTGTIGPAMKFYKEFKDYLMFKGDTESLDGGSTRTSQAEYAVVAYGDKQPPSYELLDE